MRRSGNLRDVFILPSEKLIGRRWERIQRITQCCSSVGSERTARVVSCQTLRFEKREHSTKKPTGVPVHPSHC